MAEIYRSVNAAGAVAAAENERGEMLRRAGRPGEAAGHFERALAALAAVSEPDPGTHSAILNNLALTAYQQGDLVRARRCLVRSLEVGPLVGDPVGRAITYDNLGVVEVELARVAARAVQDDEPPEDAAPRLRSVDGGVRHDGRTPRGNRIRVWADVHLGEAEGCFAAAERLFRSVLPEAVDDYLRSVLNRVDAAEIRGDRERMDRLTRHAAELAAHHGVAPDNGLEAVLMRGRFLHRQRNRPRAAVELMTARLPALLPDCPAERSAAALVVLLAAAGATGDPALVKDVTARIAELGGNPGAAAAPGPRNRAAATTGTGPKSRTTAATEASGRTRTADEAKGRADGAKGRADGAKNRAETGRRG